MHLITQPIHILPCSNSAIKGNNGTNRILWYCCPNHHRTSRMFYCWNQAFQIVGFLGCSPNVNSSCCREQNEGLIWPYYVHLFAVMWCPCVMVLTPSSVPLSITSCNQRFRSCSPTGDPGFVKITSDSFCGNGLQDEYSVLLSPALQ
jgi:hypothetical protein